MQILRSRVQNRDDAMSESLRIEYTEPIETIWIGRQAKAISIHIPSNIQIDTDALPACWQRTDHLAFALEGAIHARPG